MSAFLTFVSQNIWHLTPPGLEVLFPPSRFLRVPRSPLPVQRHVLACAPLCVVVTADGLAPHPECAPSSLGSRLPATLYRTRK